MFASCSDDKTIKIWNNNTFKEIKTLLVDTEAVKLICFSNDGKYLVSPWGGGSLDKTIKIWDSLNEFIEVFTIYTTSYLESICFSPNSDSLIIGCNKTINIYNCDNWDEIFILNNNTYLTDTICFLPNSEKLAVGCNDRTIKFYNINTFEETIANTNIDITSLYFSPDGKYLALYSKHL